MKLFSSERVCEKKNKKKKKTENKFRKINNNKKIVLINTIKTSEILRENKK